MSNSYIRKAEPEDAGRIAEIIVFCYRLNFYPIFRDDVFYFSELTAQGFAEELREDFPDAWVYDDGAVKAVLILEGTVIDKLFVEPCLWGGGIGAELLDFAVNERGAETLWALEKNEKAIRFYKRHGFDFTGNKKYEEDTTEFLLEMKRKGADHGN